MPKISELNAITAVSNDDLIMVVNDPSGLPSTNKITVSNFITSSIPFANTTKAGTIFIGNGLTTNSTGYASVNANVYSESPIVIFSNVDAANATISFHANGINGNATLFYNDSNQLHFQDEALVIGMGMGPTIMANSSLYTYAQYSDGQSNSFYSGSSMYPSTYQIFATLNSTAVPSYNSTLTLENGNILLYANGYSWNFLSDGTTTLPGLLKAPQATQANNSTGSVGMISWDSNNIYVCVGTNSWKKVQLSNFS